MCELDVPDLTFPMVTLGEAETPWNLCPLLYFGGAEAKANEVADLITHGVLYPPLIDRLELVESFHDVISGKLAGGGSKETARSEIWILRKFFSWAEQEGQPLTLASVESTYINWTEFLLHRERVNSDLMKSSIYQLARTMSALLKDVLQMRLGPLLNTRIRKVRSRKSARGVQADKQNLEETFIFGQALLDICNSLTIEIIQGPIPIKIHFRSGRVLEDWSGKPPPEKLKWMSQEPTNSYKRYNKKNAERLRAVWETDTSLRTRYPLANLRIQAEMLIFIAQTGMNLAQVNRIRTGQFHYTSYSGGYQVRRLYKSRSKGEVEFDIFSEYRKLFERYLLWLNTMFIDNPEGLLFPLIRRTAAKDSAPSFYQVITICKKVGICYFSPRPLRNTRINWLLRRSRDPKMTAEMAQHTEETLLSVYEEPNLQVAMVEISRFHSLTDPAISPPGPGWCISVNPEAVRGTSQGATPPDCISPAGCLFCENQRDIDSLDHVWSLASYRHLKSLELAKYRPPLTWKGPQTVHPAIEAVNRITAKLMYFESSSEARSLWVGEALARINEGNYHPRWDGFIQLLEVHA